jgi:hypothetical protein
LVENFHGREKNKGKETSSSSSSSSYLIHAQYKVVQNFDRRFHYQFKALVRESRIQFMHLRQASFKIFNLAAFGCMLSTPSMIFLQKSKNYVTSWLYTN